jgi:hypothetical protein
LQQYYLDPKCSVIYSIDKRPDHQPDERGEGIAYGENAVESMMTNLSGLNPCWLGKVLHFEADAGAIERDRINPRPDVCFIDGEHTNDAVVRDFEFCFAACAPDAVIYFHDSPIVWAGIAAIIRSLRLRGRRFRAWKLKGSTFAILMEGAAAERDPGVRRLARSEGAFLAAMRAYRTVGHLVPAPVARGLRGWGKKVFG